MPNSRTLCYCSVVWVLLCLPGVCVSAKEPGPVPGQVTVTWVGNSFAGGADDRWVQNFFVHTKVRPDGTVHTWSHWDEGGRRFGVYRDGDVIGNQEVPANSLRTTDARGRKWELQVQYVDPAHQEWEFRPVGITCDDVPVEFPGLSSPTALAMDNAGLLLIADSLDGPRQQVLYYDVTDSTKPKLVRTFGEYGGIGAGVPGEITPTKLWGIRGLGVDAANNLYVAMSEQGSVLRAFRPDGSPLWEVHGEFFCDLVCADPTDDGATLYGIQERYRCDWSQPPGRDTQWVSYTLNRHKYPHDPRGLMHVKQQGEHGLTSPQLAVIEGKKFLFVGGMFASNFINIFRFDGEVAVPSGLILQWEHGLYNTDQKWPPNKPSTAAIWRDRNGNGDYEADEFAPNTPRIQPGPFHVDSRGNLWMAYGFFRYDCQGLDEHGNPMYSADKVTLLDKPQHVGKVARVVYLEPQDTLVIGEEGEDMRHISRVHICPRYLEGHRETVSFVPGAGDQAGCLAAAGYYAFTGGWEARGRIWVNRLSDGALVGTLNPEPLVGQIENTGWIDLLTGISAYKRQNGEYLVFVEENARAKVLIYRWRPEP